jgi:hypothetical protein
MRLRLVPALLLLPLVLSLGCGDTTEAPPPAPRSSSTDGTPGFGCEGTKSSSVPTNQSQFFCTGEMIPTFSVQSYGASVKVYASLTVPGGFVRLADGDRLVATVGNLTSELAEDISGGAIHYTADLAITGEADVTISFFRPSPRRSAPSTVVHVPPPFDLSQVPTDLAYSGVFHVQMQPPPASEAVAVRIDGPCVLGTDTVGKDAVLPVVGTDVAINPRTMLVTTGGCAVRVRLRETQQGTPDPAFLGAGSIEGLQERAFDAHIHF